MAKNKELSGFLLVLTTAFISGFSIFINKFGVKEIDPYLFTGSKNFLTAIFLFALVLMTGKVKDLRNLRPQDWLTLFLIGLFGGSLPFLLFFKGLSLTSAAQASFIHKNMFIFVALPALIFLKEPIERNFIAAALLLLGGNVLFFKLSRFNPNRGDLLILLATILWAGESIISKKILGHLPAKTVAFGRMFFGSLLIGLFLLVTGQISLIGQLTGPQMSWIVFTSLFLLGYVVTWYSGLKLIRVSLATAILTLGSLITTLLSLTSGARLGINEVAGIVFLLMGIVFICLSLPLTSEEGIPQHRVGCGARRPPRRCL